MPLTEREELVWRETIEAPELARLDAQAARHQGAYSGPWWMLARLQMVLIAAVGVLIICMLLAPR